MEEWYDTLAILLILERLVTIVNEILRIMPGVGSLEKGPVMIRKFTVSTQHHVYPLVMNRREVVFSWDGLGVLM